MTCWGRICQKRGIPAKSSWASSILHALLSGSSNSVGSSKGSAPRVTHRLQKNNTRYLSNRRVTGRLRRARRQTASPNRVLVCPPALPSSKRACVTQMRCVRLVASLAQASQASQGSQVSQTRSNHTLATLSHARHARHARHALTRSPRSHTQCGHAAMQ